MPARATAGRTKRHVGNAWISGAILLGLSAWGCGGSDSGNRPAAPSGEGAEPSTEDGSDAALEFSIDGRQERFGAQARLEVLEGVDSVHLAISGADRGDDYVLIDVQFANIETTMGAHAIDLGLPGFVDNYVNLSLDGDPYYSRGGRIEMTLTEDGNIAGTFEFALASDEAQPGAPTLELAPSDAAMPLSGEFSGKWVLSCHSRLPGHSALVSGGPFCEDLDF